MSGTDWKNERVAVLYGGRGSERDISIKTGRAFLDALELLGVPHVGIDLYGEAVVELIDSKPTRALLAMHGRIGEGGPVQGLLELLEIPYTGSGVLASALAIDKVASKEVLDAKDVPTPAWWTRANDVPGEEFEGGRALIVKPAFEGSSVGVSRVQSVEELHSAASALSDSGQPVLIEQCIVGDELTVGFIDGEVLGAVEIVTPSGFYDFEAKYQSQSTEYHIPPRLAEGVTQAAISAACSAWSALRCRGVGRIDVLVDDSGNPWVLEANTVPGMTPTSLVPKLAEARGQSFESLVEQMLTLARLDGGES